jgi:hypothetical protein
MGFGSARHAHLKSRPHRPSLPDHPDPGRSPHHHSRRPLAEPGSYVRRAQGTVPVGSLRGLADQLYVAELR